MGTSVLLKGMSVKRNSLKVQLTNVITGLSMMAEMTDSTNISQVRPSFVRIDNEPYDIS